jgi:biopolymer transport protein ExbB
MTELNKRRLFESGFGLKLLAAIVLLGVCFSISPEQPTLWAQSEAQLNPAGDTDELIGGVGVPVDVVADDSDTQAKFNLLELLFKGGVLMVPILLMSVLVIGLVFERILNLRERKILPRKLVDDLGRLASSANGFDPKQAYRVCQEYPSSASAVIRSMLLKVGRPQSEVERAVSEASDREASRLYSNVRWLNLIAAVAPLIGLFGTVWGMIQAFFQTTQLTAGQNKSVFLAEGIYVALVTTLGGLAVAIPAAIFSHYFEGRIQNLFYQIDELLFNLMPQIERFEGRLRMNHRDFGGQDQSPATSGSTNAKVSSDPSRQPPLKPSSPQQGG